MFFLILLDADCSGRTLATLLVAWVATAMVASILLRWEYMWIVLAILTMLFLFVCGYTAYYVKRAHARMLIEEQRRAIRTISGIAERNNRREMERSAYATQLTVDLPPSYASVMSAQPTSTPPPASLQIDRSGEDKFEEPPPYSTVINISVQEQTAQEASSVSNTSSSALTKKDDAISDSAPTATTLVSASASAPLRCVESS
ncbi:uncharacterized protein LOC105277585 isoform X2 [Ooceraea biroi]|uniref:uncharacterized protein LOC105277585 isoform X2 n=1 Tax=Ooceraea biroi TaxID=2015173 RepID=UPI0005B8692E|nr:uncharacterized protein LOC105277585 isoform X2 [Ooceraea biroi]